MGIYTKEDCLREIGFVSQATSDIKNAIRDKGVSVPDDAPLYQYADFIREIEAGGGSDLPPGIVPDVLNVSFPEISIADFNTFLQERGAEYQGYRISGNIDETRLENITFPDDVPVNLGTVMTLLDFLGPIVWDGMEIEPFSVRLPEIALDCPPMTIEMWEPYKDTLQQLKSAGVNIFGQDSRSSKFDIIEYLENPDYGFILPPCDGEGGANELDWTFTSEVAESDSWYDEEGDTYGAFIEARSFLEIDTPVFFGTEEQYNALPGYISKPPISGVTFLPMPTIELADGTSLIVTGTDLEGDEVVIKSYKFGDSLYSEPIQDEQYNQGDAFSDVDGMYRFAGVIGPFEEFELSSLGGMFSDHVVYNYNSQPRPNWSRGFDVDMFSLGDNGFTDVRFEFKPIFKITSGDKTMTTDFGGSFIFDVHFPTE